MNRGLILAALLLVPVAPAAALEFGSTARAAVLYDAPSTAGSKVAVASAGVPFERLFDSGAWVKVRGPDGRLAWIEQDALGGDRTVLVKRGTVTVWRQPSKDAEAVFRARAGVVLKLTGKADAYGWLPVQHPDGLAGWIPASEVWGQ